MWQIFIILQKIFSTKNIISIFHFKKESKKRNQSLKNCKKLPTIWKVVWDFIFSYFLILPNLAKYTLGILKFEQHCKIEKKKNNWNSNMTWVMRVFFFIRVSLNHLHYCVNEIETNLHKFVFLLSINSTKFAKICKKFTNFFISQNYK